MTRGFFSSVKSIQLVSLQVFILILCRGAEVVGALVFSSEKVKKLASTLATFFVIICRGAEMVGPKYFLPNRPKKLAFRFFSSQESIQLVSLELSMRPRWLVPRYFLTEKPKKLASTFFFPTKSRFRFSLYYWQKARNRLGGLFRTVHYSCRGTEIVALPPPFPSIFQRPTRKSCLLHFSSSEKRLSFAFSGPTIVVVYRRAGRCSEF